MLRGFKLTIATPMYGGKCDAAFATSLLDLVEALVRIGVEYVFDVVPGDSLISRARNTLAARFLQRRHDLLLFIDADIEFSPLDALTLMAHIATNRYMDIVCGAYPVKRTNWDAVQFAARRPELGFAPSPASLPSCGASYFINFHEEDRHHPPTLSGAPVRIKYGGTGFMMIRRETLQTIASRRPDLHYRVDGHAGVSREQQRQVEPENMVAFFDCGIDPLTRRYLSEDFMFSQVAESLGMRTYLMPAIKLSHHGPQVFRGSLALSAHLAAAMERTSS